MAQILILDDEIPLLQSLSLELGRGGHRCLPAETGAEALRIIKNESIDMAILDVQLPDIDGLEVLRSLRAELPEVPVLMVTAFASVDSAVEAMKEGALDYLEKPLDLEELNLVVERELENAEMRRLVDAHERVSALTERKTIVGECEPIKRVLEVVEQLSKIPIDNAAELPTILLGGETGVGKDLLARYIHEKGSLSRFPFLQVNCSGLPKDLIESELFGHEKGSFTGASQQKQGLFEVAAGGTIFLDEIGDMPLEMQTKLLNVLETKKVRRVGGTREYSADVRIIAATNQNLEQASRDGTFRSDLYYRLKVVSITLPALRERGRDLDLLIDHFVAIHGKKYRKESLSIPDEVRTELRQYGWPGNVRELAHTVERMVLISNQETLASPSLDLQDAAGGSAAPPPMTPDRISFDFENGSCTLAEVETRLLEQALDFTGGNVSEVARLLGLTRGALRHRLDKRGL
ncbi:MAG: sigma-54-dependent Fis family transcriptional regulator [Planctomycetia bacterium]|nr:sigma-54-dependent Fis family transcriptional regulator [Planctomycetia bacterium]MBL6914398.1 sigma-54-dependent Fis family transcriptional regulator [Planctomycetota bacterium]